MPARWQLNGCAEQNAKAVLTAVSGAFLMACRCSGGTDIIENRDNIVDKSV